MSIEYMWCCFPQDLLEQLLTKHGVVCITRSGTETAQVLDAPGTLLNAYRSNVAIVQDPVPNEVSSSRVGGDPWGALH